MVGEPGASPRPGNYAVQAETYDLTRAASPTVVSALARYFGSVGKGRLLLDVAGGTGNYARAFEDRGFRCIVVDAQIAMLARATAKLRRSVCLAGDALSLPFADRSIGCAMCVNAIHLFTDPLAALAEARRVVRDGPVCVTAFTRENRIPLFVFEYFGRGEEISGRPSNDQIVDMFRTVGFARVEHAPYVYSDTTDGSLNALHIDARRLADLDFLRNTSLWHRVEADVRSKAFSDLARDLKSGELDRRVRESMQQARHHGHGTIFAGWP